MREFFRFLRLFVWPFPILGRLGNAARLNVQKLGAALGDFASFVAFENVTLAVVAAVFVLALLSCHPSVSPLRLTITAGISAFAIVLFLGARWARGHELWREQRRRLVAPCRPDNDPLSMSVEMRGGSRFDRQNFIRAFHEVPSEATDVLLVLRQTRKRFFYRIPPYTTESLRRQLEERNNDDRAKNKNITWVCFATYHRTFVAYQSYSKFAAEILEKRNSSYADILNTGDFDKFRELLQGHRDEEVKLKQGKSAKLNTIPGVEFNMLPNFLNREEALFLLHRDKIGEAMLVSKEERKALGMVTQNKLLSDTVMGAAQKLDPATLKQRIKAWLDDSGAAIITLETVEPAIPGGGPDDDPQLDATLPFSQAANRWRKGADLRFTPP